MTVNTAVKRPREVQAHLVDKTSTYQFLLRICKYKLG